MEKLTDWNSLWRELVEIKANSRKHKYEAGANADIWADRATEYREGVKRRWARPDNGSERNRSYALQWYSFAALAAFLYVALNLKRARRAR